MDIKVVQDVDFMQLLALNYAMYISIDPNINEFQATNTLLHYINTANDFRAIGLYNDNKLEGFVTGFNNGNDMFYFSGIYLEHKNTEWTKKLIDAAFALVQSAGYKGWEVDATNANIASIMEKYGAEVKYTRYKKEFV